MKFVLCGIMFILFSCSNKSTFEKLNNSTFQEFKKVIVNPLDVDPPKNFVFHPYSLGNDETFFQFDKKIPIDIILSIDNSGSMDSFIKKIAGNIENLLNALDSFQFNYQVGVLKSNDFLNRAFSTRPLGNTPIVRSSESDHTQKIVDNINFIRLTEKGINEKPMTIFQNALEDQDNHKAEGLFRSTSATVFISLSDFGENLAQNWSYVDYYFNTFQAYFTNRLWTYVAIGSPANNPCFDAESTDHWVIENVSKRSGGTMGRICDTDYSQIMTSTIQSIFSMLRSFTLEVPAGKTINSESIVVKVGGQIIPNSSQSGYVWNEFTNTISFPGSYFPNEGQYIEVYSEYLIF